MLLLLFTKLSSSLVHSYSKYRFPHKKNNNSKHRQFLNFLSLTQWIVLECSLICVFKPCSSQASLLWHLSTPHNHMNLHWQIFISHLCWIVRTKNEKLAEKWEMVRTFHCFEVRTTISTGIRTYFAHELLDWFLSPTQFSQKKLVDSWNWFALSQKLGSEPQHCSSLNFDWLRTQLKSGSHGANHESRCEPSETFVQVNVPFCDVLHY